MYSYTTKLLVLFSCNGIAALEVFRQLGHVDIHPVLSNPTQRDPVPTYQVLKIQISRHGQLV